MRDFLKKLRSPWDEKRKLAATGLVCAVLLIVALLLPLAFRAPVARTETGLPLEERSALFTAWWYGGDEAVELERDEDPDRGTVRFCERRMNDLADLCIDDDGVDTARDTAGEYISIAGGDGTLRLCRMWLRELGDWDNWLDACFDADTGLIYYLYLKREYLGKNGVLPENISAFGDAPEEDGRTAAAVARWLAEESGGELRRFLDDGADGGTALILRGGDVLCYTVSCVWMDTLVDIRVGCQ